MIRAYSEYDGALGQIPNTVCTNYFKALLTNFTRKIILYFITKPTLFMKNFRIKFQAGEMLNDEEHQLLFYKTPV